MMDMMINNLEAKQATLAETIAAFNWICECLADDATVKNHFRRCHQCGQWHVEGLFLDLPPVECRPLCGMCSRKLEHNPSPA